MFLVFSPCKFFPSGSKPKASPGLYINFFWCCVLVSIHALYTAGHHQTSPTSNLNYKEKLDFNAGQPLQVEQSSLKKRCVNKKYSKKFNFVKIKIYTPDGFVR